MTLKIFSFGGGVQSTAVLVLAAQGVLDYQTFLFCNVGADSENPDTLRYVQQVARPFAEQHGLNLLEVQRMWHKGPQAGQPVTLYSLLTRPNSRSIGIPVRLSNGAPGRRSCTVDFKINVADRWLKDHGAKQQGAMVGLGISYDESLRLRYPLRDPETPWKQREYPLYDLRLTRQDCMNIIQQAGLPIPPKSSCYFCPYHSLRTWQTMRHTQPELFQKACDLEKLLHDRCAALGKGSIWFTDKGKPLAQATTDYQQRSLFDEESPCESGYCFV